MDCLSTTPKCLTAFASNLGWIGIEWQINPVVDSRTGTSNVVFAVNRLTFGHRIRGELKDHWQCEFPHKATLSREQRKVIEKISQYASGKNVGLSNIPVTLSDRTRFQQSVLRACQRVRWGQTISYGELAAAAGSPNSARAVGNVMANNRTPLIIPCHRVLASGGRIGGFTAPGGLDTKRRLLELESAAS